jgi:cytochrome P450
MMTDAHRAPAGTGGDAGAVRADTGRAPAAARFDDALDAWVLSRYTDVAAALRDARLSAAGGGADDRAAHDGLRESAARALAPDHVHEWRATVLASARRAVGRLPTGRPVDLVAAFARPWSRDLAMMVAGANPADADTLVTLARDIFLAAANATDSRCDTGALAATAALARSLPAADPAVAVQAFVALAETLPCTLAAMWLELLDRPETAPRLRQSLQAQADRMVSRIIEELLRLASPDRAVFRCARTDLHIGEARMKAGDRVILLLAAANRDPAAFPQPDEVDPSRSGPPHLTFGRGSHRCAGASVVRMAVTVATAALLETGSSIVSAGPVEWLDGFAIRAPVSLPAVLHLDR